jgi:hypothetical protein
LTKSSSFPIRVTMEQHRRNCITVLCVSVVFALCMGLKPVPDFMAIAAVKGQKPSSYLFEKARKNRLLLIGTQHSSSEVQNLIAESLPGLVSLGGVNTLFVEIPSSQQETIKRFLEGKATIHDITMWQMIATDAYFQVILKARDLGMKIVAIDNNNDPSISRDTWMAQRVSEYLTANSDARGVIVVGNRHVLKHIEWACKNEKTLADNLDAFKPFSVVIWPNSMKATLPVALDVDSVHFNGVKDPTLGCINTLSDTSLSTAADGIILMPKAQAITAQVLN